MTKEEMLAMTTKEERFKERAEAALLPLSIHAVRGAMDVVTCLINDEELYQAARESNDPEDTIASTVRHQLRVLSKTLRQAPVPVWTNGLLEDALAMCKDTKLADYVVAAVCHQWTEDDKWIWE